jgi:HEAT repeat protein
VLTLEELNRAFAAGGVVVVLCLLSLLLMRFRVESRRRIIEDATAKIEPLLHAWLIFDADIDALRVALRSLQPHAAFRSLAKLCTHKLTLENQQALARELRNERWVARILKKANSPFWWRRFDAGRMLTIVGTEEDQAVVVKLLQDRNSAVRLVAMDAAARLTSRKLVETELDTLATRQDAVQAYQISALSRRPVGVSAALVERLNIDADPVKLISWIDAAGALVHPAALEKVRSLAGHPNAEVRVHVARALRRLADPDTPAVLVKLLRDEDWRVRAQSARALGALRCGSASAELASAVHDKSWWVRYRSALALTQIGGPGKDALKQLRHGDDAMARDMSILVAGLTNAAVVEMSEV